MKKVFLILGKILSGIISFFLILLPVVIIFSSISDYTNLTNPLQDKEYAYLFGAITFIGMIAGLALRASSSCTGDKEKKEALYDSGERIFHALICLILATVLRYYMERKFKLPTTNSSIYSLYGFKATTFILNFSIGLLYIYGTAYCMLAILKLKRVLIKGHEWPYGSD